MHASLDFSENDAALDQAAELVRAAKRLAVLTGAGISAESGVPTFRGAGGLWEGHRVEEVACPEAFARDPLLVWRFYNLRRKALRTIEPNDGHRALAALEARLGSGFTLITQNIDGLHARAGNRNVLEVHGRLSRVKCSRCRYVEDRPGVELPELPECPACGALLRPDVVWFGELLPPSIWQAAVEATTRCDCFLVVGTSAQVYPAAGLIQQAQQAGAAVIECNTEETPASVLADVVLRGPSGRMLPEVVRRMG
jgi:NAD-dependent deacetylase